MRMCMRWDGVDIMVNNALQHMDGFDLGRGRGGMIMECSVNGMEGVEQFVFE